MILNILKKIGRIFYDSQMDFGCEDTVNLKWKKHRTHIGMGLLGPAVYHGFDKSGSLVGSVHWNVYSGTYDVDEEHRFYLLEDAKKYVDGYESSQK